MAAPANGAPTASPRVRDDPCQPIASPRTCSGTRRLTASAVALSTGAHSAPAGRMARASHSGPPAAPIGIVSRPSPSSRAKGGTGRRAAPYTRPPAIEATPQAVKINPVSVTAPSALRWATTPTSLPASTIVAAAVAAKIGSSEGVNQPLGRPRPVIPCPAAVGPPALPAGLRVGGLSTSRPRPAPSVVTPTPISAAWVDTPVATATPIAGPAMNEISTPMESIA